MLETPFATDSWARARPGRKNTPRPRQKLGAQWPGEDVSRLRKDPRQVFAWAKGHFSCPGGTITKTCLFKMRSVRTIRMAVVSRRDLSFPTLSRRKLFPPQTHISGGDDGGARISRPSQTPSHHAGITYPVRVPPLTPMITNPGKS